MSKSSLLIEVLKIETIYRLIDSDFKMQNLNTINILGVFLKTKFIDKKIKYDGSQLKSLYAFLQHGVQGDSVVSWEGSCDIPTSNIVDGQDLLEQAVIRSDSMLHFIIEIFDAKLIQMVLLQRLFCEIVKDEVRHFSKGQVQLIRDGDDLYFPFNPGMTSKPIKNEDLKLNISIATVSPVSGLVHFGINTSSKNTPVKTISIVDIQNKVNRSDMISNWAEQLMEKLASEYRNSLDATQKVKWVN